MGRLHLGMELTQEEADPGSGERQILDVSVPSKNPFLKQQVPWISWFCELVNTICYSRQCEISF